MALILAVIVSSSYRLSGDCFCTLGSSDSHRGKNLGGFKSGECGTHSVSHLLLMSWSSNRCLSHDRMLLEVWGVGPSCWNHCSSLVMVLRGPSATKNFLSTIVVLLTISPASCKCLQHPRRSFGIHFGENIKVRLFDQQTGSFEEWPGTNWS